jgi:hypothetical protein
MLLLLKIQRHQSPWGTSSGEPVRTRARQQTSLAHGHKRGTCSGTLQDGDSIRCLAYLGRGRTQRSAISRRDRRSAHIGRQQER